MAEQIMRWRNRDGTVVLVPSGNVAARYFFLRHPVPGRQLARRLQSRVARLAALAVPSARDHSVPRPWWVDAGGHALGMRVADWFAIEPVVPEGKTIGFLFAEGARSPTAVAKIAGMSHGVGRVERGYRALELLREFGAISLGLAPEPLGFIRSDDGVAMGSLEAAVPGRCLDSFLNRRDETHYVNVVTDWLIALGTAKRHHTTLGPWATLFKEVVERFEENAATLIDPGLLREARAVIESVDSLPRVFEHHDCAPWNLYMTPERRLVGLDWDNANPDGVPGFDLLQALAYIGFAVDGVLGSRRFAESIARRQSGRISAVVRACRERYGAAMGVDESSMRAIRVFAWMRLSNDEIEARRRTNRPLAPSEIGRSMLGLWQAEARSSIDSH